MTMHMKNELWKRKIIQKFHDSECRLKNVRATKKRIQMKHYTHMTSRRSHFQTEVQCICLIKNTYPPYVKGSTSKRVAKYRLLSKNREQSWKSKRKPNNKQKKIMKNNEIECNSKCDYVCS